MASFPAVTLLITHYNRSKSLERLLGAFKALGVMFGDIIVSDDNSKGLHVQAIEHLQTRYSFKLITAPVNRGLGNNLNKGQDAVATPYTLYVQEDFVPTHKFLSGFEEAYS
ncbi:glycosyltransferase, partial [Hymenobacter defluvii]